ncbi:MAG: hypothetical protein NW216_06480 [Hyphomicrobium sp.]|nr:hypothetical protein [Hyphomicrobium sp.]
MPPDLTTELWKIAIPLSTLMMAFASAVFGFLAWRSEGPRRRAEARRARLEATIDDLAELFAAIPHSSDRWNEAFTQTFVEKVCKVDFKIDSDNPHADELVRAIQDILPRNSGTRDEAHMARYNAARIVAKKYLDLEWANFKSETSNKK